MTDPETPYEIAKRYLRDGDGSLSADDVEVLARAVLEAEQTRPAIKIKSYEAGKDDERARIVAANPKTTYEIAKRIWGSYLDEIRQDVNPTYRQYAGTSDRARLALAVLEAEEDRQQYQDGAIDERARIVAAIRKRRETDEARYDDERFADGDRWADWIERGCKDDD